MADQQRKVSLIFEANANQAKNEINSLIASFDKKLQDLTNGKISFEIIEEIISAK